MRKKLLFIFSAIIFTAFIFSAREKEQAEAHNKSIRDIQNVYKLSEFLTPEEKQFTAAEILSLRLENHGEILTNSLDLSCEIIVTDSFYNLDILKKEKALTFYGKALFTVCFDETEQIISYDEEEMIVEIYVNEPELFDVYIENEKTVADETYNGLLRFGDMNFTADEYNSILLQAEEAMKNEALSPKNIFVIKENATVATKKLLEEILIQAGFLGYEIKIIFLEK